MTSLLIGKGIIRSQIDDTTASTLKETCRELPLDTPRKPRFRFPPNLFFSLLPKLDPVLALDFYPHWEHHHFWVWFHFIRLGKSYK